MDFTPRTQQILEILLGGKGPVSKQEIADRLGVSKRTIQREFGFLENDIKQYGLHLINRKGKGIVLSGELQNIEKLRREIEKNSGVEAAGREERRKHLPLPGRNPAQPFPVKDIASGVSLYHDRDQPRKHDARKTSPRIRRVLKPQRESHGSVPDRYHDALDIVRLILKIAFSPFRDFIKRIQHFRSEPYLVADPLILPHGLHKRNPDPFLLPGEVP